MVWSVRPALPSEFWWNHSCPPCPSCIKFEVYHSQRSLKLMKWFDLLMIYLSSHNYSAVRTSATVRNNWGPGGKTTVWKLWCKNNAVSQHAYCCKFFCKVQWRACVLVWTTFKHSCQSTNSFLMNRLISGVCLIWNSVWPCDASPCQHPLNEKQETDKLFCYRYTNIYC